MSSFSDYTEAAVLNHLYGSTTFNKPGKFLALFSAAPSDAGGGTELSAAGGYARLALPNMTVSGTNPTLATNGAAIEWPATKAAWSAPVTHIAVFDASSGGNMLAWAPLVVSRTVNTGEVFRVSAGDLDITVDTFAASGSVVGAINLLTYSEQFNAEAWRATMPNGQPIVAANVSVDAQGRQTVDELSANYGTGHWVRQHVSGLVVGQTYTFSVDLQQGRSGPAASARLTTNNTLAWNTGASTKVPLTASLVRHSLTWTQQGSTTAAIMIGATDAAGTGDDSCIGTIRMANAMLNVGPNAAPYVRTGEAEATANLLTYSEQFNAEAWRATMPNGQPIVAANVSADAQGRQTVDELSANYGTGHWVRQHVSGLVVGQTYTFSVDLQQGRSGPAASARLTTNNTLAWNTGASTKVPLTASLVRHSLTWTQQGSTTAAIMIGATDAAGTGDDSCIGTIRMANAMLNVGPNAAPYVRTGEAEISNLLRYSEQFNVDAWRAQMDSSKLVIEPNVSVDTQGRQTVDELTTNFAGSYHVRQHVTDLVVGQTYTFSAEVQQGRAGSAAAVRLTTNNTLAWNTGASTKAPLTANLVRRSVTWVQQGGTTAAILIGVTDVDGGGGGDNDCFGTIRMANAMLNVGSAPATYIRTGEADTVPLPPLPPTPPATNWPAKIFGVYFEAYMQDRFGEPGYPRVETLPDQQYNLIYLFNTSFNSDGSVNFPQINTTTREEVQRCRARGQKVMLTLGGAQRDFIYENPTQAQNCVNSVRGLVDGYGGLDGIDFNNYEAAALTTAKYPNFLREMRNISGQLRTAYGDNFLFSSPAQPDPDFNHPQRRFTRDMIASGHLDLTNPQMYDWNGWKDLNRMSNIVISWIDDCCAGDASKCIVGFGADYFSPYTGDQNNGDGITGGGPNNEDNQREWDRIKRERPGVRGMFGWSHESIWGYGRRINGIVTSRFPGQRNVWGNRMHPRL